MTRRRILRILLPLAMLTALAAPGGPAPVAAAESTVYADLFGDEVVPGPGAPEGEGSAVVTIDPAAGTLCWVLMLGVDLSAAAEIRAGAAGENGPLVAALTEPLDGGCLDVQDPATLQAILDAPDSYYLVVNTADFPDGAARGQLTIGTPPSAPCSAPDICGGTLAPGTYTWYGFVHPMTFTLAAGWEASFPGGNLALAPDSASAVYFFPIPREISDGSCGDTPTYVEMSDAFDASLANIPGLTFPQVGSVDFAGDGDPPVVSQFWFDLAVSLPDGCASMALFPGGGVAVGGGTDGGDGGSVEPGGLGSSIAMEDSGGFSVVDGEKVRFVIWGVDDEVILIAIDKFGGDGLESLIDQANVFQYGLTWGPVAVPVEGGEAEGGEAEGGSDNGGGDVSDTALPLPSRQPVAPILPAGVLLLGGVIGLSVVKVRRAASAHA